MKERRNSIQRRFFGSRAFLVCTGSIWLLWTGMLRVDGNLVCSRTQAEEQLRGTLTFAERVGFQYAIEEIYWRHRTWPTENFGSKPSLCASVSERQIHERVKEYLRKSELIADRRKSAITPFDLQAEMDRMASQTRQPEILRELFAALGNDPFVIAECLARPVVAERLLREAAAEANPEVMFGLDRTTNRNAIADVSPLAPNNTASEAPNVFAKSQSKPPNAVYKLPVISTPSPDGDAWVATTTINAPDARILHTAIWTSSEMIVWGGFNFSTGVLNNGGRYNPNLDSWTTTKIAGAPMERALHTAVWTGSEMIVWGGYNNGKDLGNGARYNPSTDSWTVTSPINAPEAREQFTAVWTGSEMIVWGGRGCGSNCILNTGGRYNPANDSWMPLNSVNAPTPRFGHTAIWSGSEMVVWGGSNRFNYLHTGGRYDPKTDNWTPTSDTNAAIGRTAHTAVWAGNEVIVWGGVDETFSAVNTGARYNPNTDSWALTTILNAPSPRADHTGVWTGKDMAVWGGEDSVENVNTGGRYNPNIDSWTPTATANAPSARNSHTAIWSGDEMIVWGGSGPGGVLLNTGGRYGAQPSATATPSPTATATVKPEPTATSTPTATPTPIFAHALNLSTRLNVGIGDDVGIGGFIITGTASKTVLIRGIGPSLGSVGIANPLADPVLQLHSPSGETTNNNWRDMQEDEIIATGIPPTDDLEAAILATLNPGAYTAILSGNSNGTGVGLVEIYDLNAGTGSKLANLSTRALVNTGNEIVIGGFILGDGSENDPIILRGMGPSLPGLPNVLADPILELRNSDGAIVESNDNWMDDTAQAAIIAAAGLAPGNELESGIAVELAPGAYTALLAGTNNGMGVGLIEIYDNPAGTISPSPTPAATPTPTATAGVCTEDFDKVIAPALPPGWVASNLDPGDGVLWMTSTLHADTPPNAAFIPVQDGISDKVLDWMGVNVTTANAQLSFRNNFNTDDGLCHDGYVLEVSAPNINGGKFVDVTDVGTLVTGDYTCTIDATTGNPLAGRMAWSGNSNGYVDTVVNFGASLAGQTVTLRFRMGTDEAVPWPGANIDSLAFVGAACP